MSESKAERRPLRRTVLGPVAVTGVLIALAVAATVSISAPLITGAGSIVGAGSIYIPSTIVGAGWVLAWLLLGLTAGYALSGSA